MYGYTPSPLIGLMLKECDAKWKVEITVFYYKGEMSGAEHYQHEKVLEVLWQPISFCSLHTPSVPLWLCVLGSNSHTSSSLSGVIEQINENRK